MALGHTLTPPVMWSRARHRRRSGEAEGDANGMGTGGGAGSRHSLGVRGEAGVGVLDVASRRPP
ncbi:hypothetical protein E2562_016539 [Oryza meyeriana var. granulata]|uniref:DUF834 domain-containing protein n=1 Tax=Oryza meyeriana var. granulata TaxID=110450 RepID=A0A6G1C6M3_9ORYZ|nr:hypothetical protein E2562_016539 [Oryza meyeriana var. granulata]